MKNCWRIAGSILIVLACWVTNTQAETRYISDQLVVSLREQPQKGAQSIIFLKTDVSVEVLEEAGAFFKVKTKAGEIGYIKQNYLTATTPKTVVIKQLQKERDRLANKVDNMQQQVAKTTSQSDKTQQELATQLTEARKQFDALEKELGESQSTLTRTRQDYQALQEDAKNIVAITKERDQLRQTNQALTDTTAKLDEEVGALTKTGVIKWFLAGAGVLLLGWIIGKMSGGGRRRNLY